jgi:hypothetical protein
MRADDTTRQVIFDDRAGNAVAPAWWPRGDRTAFGLGRYDNRHGVRRGGVATIAADGTDLQLLLTTDGEVN